MSGHCGTVSVALVGMWTFKYSHAVLIVTLMVYHSVPHARSGRPRVAFTYEIPRGITCTNFESSPCTLTYTLAC